MKFKTYTVKLTSPVRVYVKSGCSYTDVDILLDKLDDLWGIIELEEWKLEISPYWEEVGEEDA